MCIITITTITITIIAIAITVAPGRAAGRRGPVRRPGNPLAGGVPS